MIYIIRPVVYVVSPLNAMQGNQGYLGEDGSQDAFHTLMEILAARIPYGYRPAPEILDRFTHRGFPCRSDIAPDHVTWPRQQE